jgi:hypothetical protein
MYVFNTKPKSPYLYEVPYPSERSCALNISDTLFSDSSSTGLFISASHAFSNVNQSSDVLFYDNKESLFNLMNQVTLREYASPLMPVQVKAMMPILNEKKTMDDIYLAFQKDAWHYSELESSQKQLYDSIEKLGLSIYLVKGDEVSRGYEVKLDAQSRYVPLSSNNDFASILITPTLINKLSFYAHSDRNIKNMRALDVAVVNEPLYKFLAKKQIIPTAMGDLLLSVITEYLNGHHLSVLYTFLKDHQGVSMTYLYTGLCEPSYLVFSQKNNVIFIAALDFFSKGSLVVDQKILPFNIIHQFLKDRYQCLYLKG